MTGLLNPTRKQRVLISYSIQKLMSPENALDIKEGSIKGQGDARAVAVRSFRFTLEGWVADDRAAALIMRAKQQSSKES